LHPPFKLRAADAGCASRRTGLSHSHHRADLPVRQSRCCCINSRSVYVRCLRRELLIAKACAYCRVACGLNDSPGSHTEER
jgi:hypothetical protein